MRKGKEKQTGGGRDGEADRAGKATEEKGRQIEQAEEREELQAEQRHEIGWAVVFWSLRVLSRSRRLSCVFCRDPADCLSLVPVWSVRTRKVFWLVWEVMAFRHKRVSHGCRAGPRQGLKGSGGCNNNRWQKGVDVQILFGVECVDKMALQAMLFSHPGVAVREAITGRRSKVSRLVYWLVGLEWGGREKSSKLGSRE